MTCVLWIVIGCGVIMFLCLVWHMTTPPSWHFLTGTQIDDLKSTLISGAFGGFVASYFKKSVH
jgi:hypothetical protein